ncbi:LysR family transcriptional regulator [Paenibacillus sp. UMB7766-LJ446]|uniref:LysR family transcriptional regulator n=1 Tax=Paenibacillus sp. UMB7766-LJ446 TaxID=3046313 RepID=UPI00254E321A|nr:LysR family transcriptional regulator [Paenibacillus sp. UMB7766-LJ446]MDK8191181.1 LysR family transcriptional regulator [Paenibacillus sp. UMB7766-LJ446]
MELLQLRYFLTLARCEHVTEAAGKLHVTQSSLSKTIQRLEDDLGAPLFDRLGRKLRLNEFGRTFLRRTEKALFELEQGKQEIADLSNPDHGKLQLAVTTASTLPGILREFRKNKPNVQFHVQMVTLEDMSTLLHRGEIDFCLSSPPIQGDDIECQMLFLDPIVVAVPLGHRYADRSSITLAELKDEWFVGVKKGYGIRDLVDSKCLAAGYVPKYVYEGDEPARLTALVEAEIGLAFIPGTARNPQERIVYLPIEDQNLVREIALLSLKNRYISKAAIAFRSVVIDYFGGMSQPIHD